MSRSLAAVLVDTVAALSDEELRPLAERLAGLLPRPAESPASMFLTAEEAAEFLRCRRRRVYELVGDGRLNRHGDGRRLLLRRDEVERLAAGR